jgi:hypothetical protein
MRRWRMALNHRDQNMRPRSGLQLERELRAILGKHRGLHHAACQNHNLFRCRVDFRRRPWPMPRARKHTRKKYRQPSCRSFDPSGCRKDGQHRKHRPAENRLAGGERHGLIQKDARGEGGQWKYERFTHG